MYARLCELTATRHDPCLPDVFISITRFMAGEEPAPWWAFTTERKKLMMQSNSSQLRFEAARTGKKPVN